MKYAIISDIQLPNRKWKYGAIESLEVNQGFFVPHSDLSQEALDPLGAVRTIAYLYSKRLSRKFSTRKDQLGIWVIRKG